MNLLFKYDIPLLKQNVTWNTCGAGNVSSEDQAWKSSRIPGSDRRFESPFMLNLILHLKTKLKYMEPSHKSLGVRLLNEPQ